jgi:hypothetical protein
MKLNCHWLHTPCNGVRTVEDHKPWLVIVIVIKEISQSSVQGASSVIVA